MVATGLDTNFGALRKRGSPYHKRGFLFKKALRVCSEKRGFFHHSKARIYFTQMSGFLKPGVFFGRLGYPMKV